MKRSMLFVFVLVLLITSGSLAYAAPAQQTSDLSGFRALSGASAQGFQLPSDLTVVWQTQDASTGITQTRYQQVVANANVFGGQITVLERAGQQLAVIGAHFPGLAPKNSLKLNPTAAEAIAKREQGQEGLWKTTLLINPDSAEFFYEVENQRFDSRWILWINADNGKRINKFNSIDTGTGVGVKGDTKTIDTTQSGGSWVLVSADNRQKTYDAKQAQTGRKLPGTLFTDPDNLWDTFGRTSPGSAAAVDAHYYANVTDDFYRATFNRNSIDDAGMTMISSVHYGNNYNNAFWNGSQMVYGDGDGTTTFREMSGGLDVVGHELTHGVTDYTSNLVYQNESGALNEAFSDMVGNSIEYYAHSNGLDPAATPDWYIGEDIYVASTSVPGFRNMSDPKEDGDPDHYSERYTGTEDDGGVHTNSGIPNHAYYLLVNGGRNAGCDNTGSGGHNHTADCDVTVTGIGLAKAQQIFYKAFTSLNSSATMGQARAATVAAAEALSYTATEVAATNAAWQAVGVAAAAPAASCNVDTATLPLESAHPYANNTNCTWTYTNNTPNFKLHFSLLDVEKNYDYVDIIDGNGTVLETLTGTYRTGYTTTKVITTNVVKVRLRSDASVTRQGFKVDAVTVP